MTNRLDSDLPPNQTDDERVVLEVYQVAHAQLRS